MSHTINTTLLLGCLAATTVAVGQSDSLHFDTLLLRTTTEELTVRAGRIPHGELATQRLTQLDVYANPAARADPLLAINSLPAATNPDETANVSLRGSPAAATGIYLNGVPLRSAVRLDQSNGLGQFSIFGQLPIDKLSLYPSSPPLEFSQASAGAVAVETSPRRPADVGHGVNLSLAGVSYRQDRPLGRHGALRGYVNASDPTALRALNGGSLSDLGASRSLDGMINYATPLGERRRLQAFYLGFAERYDYDVRTEAGQYRFGQRKPRHLGIVNYDFGGGSWDYRLNQSIDWERPTFRFGTDTLTIPRLTTHSALHATRRSGDRTLQWGAANNNYREFGHLRATGEAYVYFQHRSGPWLLGAGLKPSYDGRGALSGQAALRYAPNEHHRLHLSAGSHRQLLSPDEEYYDWRGLRLHQLALEYRYTLGEWTLTTAGYLKQEIYGGATPDLRVRGAEATLDYRSGDWTGQLGAATTYSRSTAGEPTRRDTPLNALGRLRWDGGSWSAGLAYRGRHRDFDYHRLDLSLTHSLLLGRAGLIFYANVNNVLDTRNVSHYSFRGEEYYGRRVVFFGAVLTHTRRPPVATSRHALLCVSRHIAVTPHARSA